MRTIRRKKCRLPRKSRTDEVGSKDVEGEEERVEVRASDGSPFVVQSYSLHFAARRTIISLFEISPLSVLLFRESTTESLVGTGRRCLRASSPRRMTF